MLKPYGDETATVDVDAILIGDMDVAVNVDIADGRVIAAVKEACPVGGIAFCMSRQGMMETGLLMEDPF